MISQVRLYCGMALVITMCSTAFGLYHKEDALNESRLNGVLYFQNTDLKARNLELEERLANVQRQTSECKRQTSGAVRSDGP